MGPGPVSCKSQHSWRGPLLFWGLLSALLGITVLSSSALLPFFLAITFAYLTNPFVESLERRNISRVYASALVLIPFFALLVITLALLVPTLRQEADFLMTTVPLYIDKCKALLENAEPGSSLDYLKHGLSSFVQNSHRHLPTVFDLTQRLVPGLWNSALTFFNIVGTVFITPLVTYWILCDWPTLMSTLQRALPRRFRDKIVGVTSKINLEMGSFVRGQLLVSLLLSAYYALMFSLCGLLHGVFLGIFIGFFSFVPIIPTLIGAILVGLTAFIQFDTLTPFVFLSLALAGGLFLDEFFLAPTIIGKKTGFHEITLLLAVYVFGELFGLLGVLLAVPLAVISRVLLQTLVSSYEETPYYRDPS